MRICAHLFQCNIGVALLYRTTTYMFLGKQIRINAHKFKPQISLKSIVHISHISFFGFFNAKTQRRKGSDEKGHEDIAAGRAEGREDIETLRLFRLGRARKDCKAVGKQADRTRIDPANKLIGLV